MINKISLRDQVRVYLLEEMVTGRLKPGSALSLAEMARTLSVSVTPIREALNQLERSGLVSAIPNRGFVLSPLSLKEALDIYPIISQLEILAIGATVFSEEEVEALKKNNETFLRSKNTKAAVMADLKFHSALVRPYNNQNLERILTDLKIRVLIYEMEYQKDMELMKRSAQQHEEIIDAVRKKNNEKAAKMVVDHWHQSMEFIRTEMNS